VRTGTDKPFFLVVSFTHPHPPFVSPRQHWDRYDPRGIDPPAVGAIDLDKLDPHSRWLHEAHGQDLHEVTPADVLRARHAYYGMVSYIDEKIGNVLNALTDTGLRDKSATVFCADHGEMLGERGMWYKQTFYEWSARVPLIISTPGGAARRIREVVSLVDLLPTFMDLAGGEVQPIDVLDGRTLLPLIRGEPEGPGEAISEYSSEGVCAPSRMVRQGAIKYIYTLGVPPLLFDLARDPHELDNRAGDPAYANVEMRLHARLLQDWNPKDVDRRVRASQRRRLFLRDVAIKSGAFPSWTYEARQGDRTRFVRPTATGAPVGAKPKMRFPYVEPILPNASSRER